MRVFVAGASGAIGRRLLPMLVEDGHQVIATTRTPDKIAQLRALGAEAVVMDGLDRDSVMRAVTASRPDAIVHQMTALASMRSFKRFDDEFATTNRLRTQGTENLLAAGKAAGTGIFVAQSYAGWPNDRRGSRVQTEEDPLEANPPARMERTLAAIHTLEALVKDSGGTVLRYGSLYGPGTGIAEDGEMVRLLRKRQFPVVGSGGGVWSFLHVDDAARAAVAAMEHGAAGVYNIVDDDPAEVRVWLPELARAVGAKPPYRLPEWIGRIAIGEAGVYLMTLVRGSSNEKAKRQLGWQPLYGSWREGFRTGLALGAAASGRIDPAIRRR